MLPKRRHCNVNKCLSFLYIIWILKWFILIHIIMAFTQSMKYLKFIYAYISEGSRLCTQAMYTNLWYPCGIFQLFDCIWTIEKKPLFSGREKCRCQLKDRCMTRMKHSNPCDLKHKMRHRCCNGYDTQKQKMSLIWMKSLQTRETNNSWHRLGRVHYSTR